MASPCATEKYIQGQCHSRVVNTPSLRHGPILLSSPSYSTTVDVDMHETDPGITMQRQQNLILLSLFPPPSTSFAYLGTGLDLRILDREPARCHDQRIDDHRHEHFGLTSMSEMAC